MFSHGDVKVTGDLISEDRRLKSIHKTPVSTLDNAQSQGWCVLGGLGYGY
jgi:hypothetical protein